MTSRLLSHPDIFSLIRVSVPVLITPGQKSHCSSIAGGSSQLLDFKLKCKAKILSNAVKPLLPRAASNIRKTIGVSQEKQC